MILTKFGEDPIRNLGGVAFTRIDIRTDVRTYGRTDGEDDDNIRPPPAAYKKLFFWANLDFILPNWERTYFELGRVQYSDRLEFPKKACILTLYITSRTVRHFPLSHSWVKLNWRSDDTCKIVNQIISNTFKIKVSYYVIHCPAIVL